LNIEHSAMTVLQQIGAAAGGEAVGLIRRGLNVRIIHLTVAVKIAGVAWRR
jgi:hypothetical protein